MIILPIRGLGPQGGAGGRLVRRGVTLSAGLLAAAAGPVGGEPSTAVMALMIGGTVRPAVTELAHTSSTEQSDALICRCRIG